MDLSSFCIDRYLCIEKSKYDSQVVFLLKFLYVMCYVQLGIDSLASFSFSSICMMMCFCLSLEICCIIMISASICILYLYHSCEAFALKESQTYPRIKDSPRRFNPQVLITLLLEVFCIYRHGGQLVNNICCFL